LAGFIKDEKGRSTNQGTGDDGQFLLPL